MTTLSTKADDISLVIEEAIVSGELAPGTVLTDAVSVARACDRYAARYRVPRENPQRVAVRIEVDRFLVSSGLVP